MNITSTFPTRPGPAGDAARRLALYVGPGLAAPDGSETAALYLALGTTLATTRALTQGALVEGFPQTAVRTIGDWERSLGMLSGEGASLADRQAAVTARWRAAHAGASLAEIITTVRAFDPSAHVIEIAMADVRGTNPLATHRFVVLLADALEDSSGVRGRLAAALSVQVPAHVAWSIARGDGAGEADGLDEFCCDDPDSRMDRDVLAY